jgi:hypothetical protein
VSKYQELSKAFAELVVETLMIPLRMIMAEVLVDRIRQGVFAQHHHLLQGLLLDGAHKPFAVGFSSAIWTGEPLDLLRHWGPPQLCAARAAGKLLGDQSPVPAHEGVWRGDGRHRSEACAAKGVGERSEATAFGVA